MTNPVRSALLAAAVALAPAMSGCGGGSSKAPTASVSPSPETPSSPGTPQAGDPSKFFPLNEERRPLRVSSSSHGDSVPNDFELRLEGTNLSNLIGGSWADQGFPQFSDFEFGSPALSNNGIPLQTATLSKSESYEAIAYQAVLDKSMFLIAGGLFNVPNSATGINSIGIGYSIGDLYTGDPVTGIYEGTAVGTETFSGGRTYQLDPVAAKDTFVTADVEIVVRMDGGSQHVDWTFDDWARTDGGSVNYPAVSSMGLSQESVRGNHNVLYFEGSGPRGSGWSEIDVNMLFYGDRRQEVGGGFFFQYHRQPAAGGSSYIDGVFGAKQVADRLEQ